MGCGTENTEGKCDTPGFSLHEQPQVKFDHRRSQKLYMPRNHPRINQTSRYMLQSWRANCDIQVLVYNGDPKNPDISEIAKITDYVVSYSCKGNVTLKEERQQTKQLVLAAEDISGNREEIQRIAKQAMNKSAAKRLISKQEAMVLLAELPLTQCTESIETVSINNSTQLRVSASTSRDKRITSEYAKRPASMENMSLHAYFVKDRNHNPAKKRRNGDKYIIPNFTGLSGTPTYPVTESYARHSMIVYCPWRTYPSGMEWIKEFDRFVNSPTCPTSCRIAYERVMQRHYDKMTGYEPKSKSGDHTMNVVDIEDLAIITLAGSKDRAEFDADTLMLKSLERGLEYKWDQEPQVSRFIQTKLLQGDFHNVKFHRKLIF